MRRMRSPSILAKTERTFCSCSSRVRNSRSTASRTLALLVGGLAIGCLNAWHWVAKEDREIRDEQEDNDE